MGTGSWNILTVTAMNLHIRLDQLLVNIFFGVSGNAAFALAVTLTSYIRMLTVGVTDGLDAVSARVSTTSKKDGAVRDLLRHTTRMTAFVALPAGLLVLVLAHPLMDLWVARRSEKAVALVPLAFVAVQILMVGMTSRAITDNWTRILYGAGFVSRYARQILVGALFNPVVAIALVYLLPGPFPVKDEMPEPYKFYGPAIAFAAVFTAVHLFFLPTIAAKCLNIRYREMFTPILPSLAVTLLCAPILLAAKAWIGHWNLFWLAGVGGAYGALYLVISMFVVVTREERQRIVKMIQRRVGGRQPGRGAPVARQESSAPIADAAEVVD
jgi:O-antigen/teichoic acid export membrane protein